MKTSTMVWVLIVVLVALMLGFYVWNQGSASTIVPTAQTEPTAEVSPTGQTQVNTNPNGANYQSAPTTTEASTSVSTDTSKLPMTAKVTYDGKNFSPTNVTIAKGGTVTFTDIAGSKMWVAADPHPSHTNYDNTTRAQHCATGATASFDQCAPSASYTFTFSKVGAWSYHDHMNAVAEGMITVK